MIRTTHLLATLVLAGAAPVGQAQVIYRCPSAPGTILLSQEPCVGGQIFEPRQSREAKPSKKEPVLTEQEREEALFRIYNPNLGERANRRSNLVSTEQRECEKLEATMPDYGSAMNSRDPALASAARDAMAANRRSYRSLGC